MLRRQSQETLVAAAATAPVVFLGVAWRIIDGICTTTCYISQPQQFFSDRSENCVATGYQLQQESKASPYTVRSGPREERTGIGTIAQRMPPPRIS